jgi:hypothetical protein
LISSFVITQYIFYQNKKMIDKFLAQFPPEPIDEQYHTITSIEMACDVIKRWTPVITDDQRKYLAEHLANQTNVIEFFQLIPDPYRSLVLLFWNCCSPMIARFRTYMQYLNLNISDNALNTSILNNNDYTPVNEHPVLCLLTGFMISLVFIMHFPNWYHYIEDLVDYMSIYILIDNYLDDLSIPDDQRKNFIKQLANILDNPKEFLNQTDPRIREATLAYLRFTARYPNSKELFKTSFAVEVSVMYLQKQAHLDRRVYYKNFMVKGIAFGLIIKPLITDSEIHKLMQLGILCQLFDDLCDVLSDLKTGTYTIATYELQTNGNLDALVIDMANRIDQFNMPVLKMLFSLGIIELVDKFPSCYSSQVHMLLKDHNLSSQMDDKWFFSRMLCSYVTEDK